MTTEKLAEGRKLLAAAEPRPWETVLLDTGTDIISVEFPGNGPVVSEQVLDADAALIVWAVNNLSDLLDAAEKSGTVSGFWTLINIANGERDAALAEVERRSNLLDENKLLREMLRTGSSQLEDCRAERDAALAEVERLREDACPGGGYHKRAACAYCD